MISGLRSTDAKQAKIEGSLCHLGAPHLVLFGYRFIYSPVDVYKNMNSRRHTDEREL